jgi:hypothetical protein
MLDEVSGNIRRKRLAAPHPQATARSGRRKK